MLRPAAFLILASILAAANAGTVHAAAPPLKSNHCPNPTSVEIDPSMSGPSVVEISLTTTPEEEANKILRRITTCPSACYDLTSSLSLEMKEGPVLKIVTTAANQCSAENRENPAAEERGCPPNQKNEPGITVILEENKLLGFEKKTIGPKSRCDEELLNLVDSSFAKMKKLDTEGLLADLEKLGKLDPPQQAGVVGGNQQLIDSLTPHIGKENAERVVAEQPDLAAQLNSHIKDGNVIGARQVAAPLELNSDTVANAARLNAPQGTDGGQKETTNVPLTSPPPTINPSGNTFSATDLDKAKQAIATIESGGRYNAVGPRTRKGNRAYGKYQVMDFNIPSWTREALGQAITPQQFLNCSECQERVFEYKFTQYVQKYGSPDRAAAVWFGGPGALKNLSASDGNLNVAQYVQRFGQVYGGAIPFGGLASAYTGGRSPFSNVTPALTSAIPVGAPFSVGSSGGGGTAPASNPVQSFFSNLLGGGGQQAPASGGTTRPPAASSGAPSGAAQPNMSQPLPAPSQTRDITPAENLLRALDAPGTTTPAPSTPIQAVASIVPQSSQITRGNSIILSWSSVGMNPATQCNVVLEVEGFASVIARGNEGSEAIPTTEETTPGMWNFKLQCTAHRDGNAIEQTASVLVQ